MIVRAIAMSAAQLESLIKDHPALTVRNTVIAIVEPGQPHVVAAGDNVLRLEFHDVDPELFDDIEAGKRFTFFSTEMAVNVVHFLRAQHKRAGNHPLIAQCQAGIARSGAVAQFTAELLSLSQETFLADNPNIGPNQHVLKLLRQAANQL